MKMQFPKDERNDIFDGKVHNIVPEEIASILIGNNKLYVLTYIENNLYGTTLLAQSKEGRFFKVPLDDYQYLDEFLNNAYAHKDGAYIQQESLSLLDNQEYIDTAEVQNAAQLFSNPNIRKEPITQTDVEILNLPPRPPRDFSVAEGMGNPPVPSSWNIDTTEKNPPVPSSWNIDTTEKNPLQTISELPPSNNNNENVEQEQERKLYIGVYGSSFAVYLGINRREKDLEDNKYRFGRNSENKTLTNEIIRLLSARENGQEIDEIHIDYGKYGESTHLIETSLPSLMDNVEEEEYDRISGKFKYKITVSDFVNADDFNKFKASKIIECQPTQDMNFRVYPENHDTVFLSLASSDIIASFTDSYGRTAENSFSEKLNSEAHKMR